MDGDTTRALATLGVTRRVVSPAQRRALDRDGYAVFEAVLPADDVDRLATRLAELEEREDAWGANTDPLDAGAVRVDDVNHKGAPFQALWQHPILLAAMHHGLWHSGSRNTTNRPRRGLFTVFPRRDQPRPNDQAARLDPATAADRPAATRHLLDA
jgi:hypothetical protein